MFRLTLFSVNTLPVSTEILPESALVDPLAPSAAITFMIDNNICSWLAQCLKVSLAPPWALEALPPFGTPGHSPC